MTSNRGPRTRTCFAMAIGGPILAILVLTFTGNVGVKYHDMTELKNFFIVPIVLGGFVAALIVGSCFAVPPRGQPAWAILGGVLSMAVFGLAFYLSRLV